MTLDKHTIQGLAAFTTKTLPSNEFEKRMLNAGYFEVGAHRGRVEELRCGGHMMNIPGLNQFIVPIKILC